MSGINPKFLNVEKKVQYNIRMPQRLIDKYNAYAELTGNTTTNIIINVLTEFITDKVSLNDYLDNIGGVTVKIPYAINQKNTFINSAWNLKEYNSTETLRYEIVDSVYTETYFAELFEVKKISNNLDIYDGDSYVANKKILQFNQNAIHSGIELFIYNITETIFADANITDEFDSFINCLYCLYFEVAENDEVNVYLIDYLTAINLLSASGNNDYKDLIIGAASELSDIDDVIISYLNEYLDHEIDIGDKYLSGDDPSDEKYDKAVAELENKLIFECEKECDELISLIANKYNSNNIIKFGTDIFSRLAVKDIKKTPSGFLDEKLDELIAEKVDAVYGEKIENLLNTENRSIEKLAEIEKINADIYSKLDVLMKTNK